jgi:hypothetical protein
VTIAVCIHLFLTMIELLPVVALVLKRDVMQRPLRARKANATPSSGAAS